MQCTPLPRLTGLKDLTDCTWKNLHYFTPLSNWDLRISNFIIKSNIFKIKINKHSFFRLKKFISSGYCGKAYLIMTIISAYDKNSEPLSNE